MTTSPYPIEAPQLNTLTNIKHGFFTRVGGVSTGIYAGLNAGLGSDDNRNAVVENRQRMATWLGVPSDQLASPYQVHSADAVITDVAWSNERPKVDGLVTNTPGLALGIVTADCGPVLFANENAGVIGACHAGWKGALHGVLENTIEKMEALGAKRSSTIAILGPTISKLNYEVGPGFPEPFLARSSDCKAFFSPSNKSEHHMFDLTGYIVDRLNSAGVHAGAVERCTYAEEENFFSYRRTTHRNEPDYGRQLSAIALKNGGT